MKKKWNLEKYFCRDDMLIQALQLMSRKNTEGPQKLFFFCQL